MLRHPFSYTAFFVLQLGSVLGQLPRGFTTSPSSQSLMQTTISSTASASSRGAHGPARGSTAHPTLSSTLGTGQTSSDRGSVFSSPTADAYSSLGVAPGRASAATMSSHHISSITTTSTAAHSSSSTTSPSTSSDHHRRNLIIILSVVLGVLVIAILVCTAFLVRRLLKRRPLVRRSVTPIDDEEIATWRVGTGGASSLDTGERKWSLQHEWVEKPPAMPTAARAPNSRSGLTDKSIPGAAPFVTPPRRNSSKLQRSPQHQRHRSGRSSVSDRPPTPYSTGPGMHEGPDRWSSEQPDVPHVPQRSESFDLDQLGHSQKLG